MYIASSGLRFGVATLAIASCAMGLAAGCGGDDDPVVLAPDAALLGVIDAVPAVGRFDGAMHEPPDSGMTPDVRHDAAVPQDAAEPEPDSGDDPDSGLPVPVLDAGVAISGATLTNAPHIGFTNVGTHDLVVVSASLLARDIGGGLVSVWMYGDLENRGTENRCFVSSELFSFDGRPDELVVVDGDPYELVGGTLGSVTACIPPGGRGVWHGISSSVPSTFIEEARELRYDFQGTTLAHVPAADAPELLYADPASRTTGYAITGIVRTRAGAIHNLQIGLFARRGDGLIYAHTYAYPLELATIAAHSTVFYESPVLYNGAEEPESVTYYLKFAKGPDTSADFAGGN